MKKTYEILGIIPARGGSKGIPKKNLKIIGGKSLLQHSIDTALKSEFITRLVVSTDDDEIANVARRSLSEVVRRPSDISGDRASSELALLHVLDELYHNEGYLPDVLVFLQCTSPLTTVEDIDGTIRMLVEECADTALSVTPFHYYLWKIDGKGEAQGINHDKNVRPMRQERAPQFLETGAVYVMRSEEFRKKKFRFFGKTVFYEMPRERCFEIDDPVDLKIAEQLILAQAEGEK